VASRDGDDIRWIWLLKPAFRRDVVDRELLFLAAVAADAAGPFAHGNDYPGFSARTKRRFCCQRKAREDKADFVWRSAHS
jgi:hypothetical protein